jgi:hypothetical protein
MIDDGVTRKGAAIFSSPSVMGRSERQWRWRSDGSRRRQIPFASGHSQSVLERFSFRSVPVGARQILVPVLHILKPQISQKVQNASSWAYHELVGDSSSEPWADDCRPFRGTEEPTTGSCHWAAELDRRRRQIVCLKVSSAPRRQVHAVSLSWTDWRIAAGFDGISVVINGRLMIARARAHTMFQHR